VKTAFGVLSVVAAMLSFSGCGEAENSFVEALHRSGEAALKTSNAVVSVSSVTRFQWEKLFIFGPYTSVDQIHAQLGYRWAEAQGTHIDSSETFYLLVFTKAGKVVQHYKFPRSLGDFENLEAGNEFSRETAAFEIGRTADASSERLRFIPKWGR